MSTPASVQTFPTQSWANVAAVIDRFVPRPSGLVGLSLIDLDNFADVVQSAAPHTDGAALIAAAAQRLAEQAEPAILGAQVDDDCFIIVRYPLAGPAEMEGLGLRIVDSFREPLLVDGNPFICTASVGVATSRTGDSSDTLLRYTQLALDDAKALGRNRMIAFADEDRELLAN